MRVRYVVSNNKLATSRGVGGDGDAFFVPIKILESGFGKGCLTRLSSLCGNRELAFSSSYRGLGGSCR